MSKPEEGSKFTDMPVKFETSPHGLLGLRTHRSLLRESAGSLSAEDEERRMRSIFNNASRIPHGHAQMSMAANMGRADPRGTVQQVQERRKDQERYATQEMQRLAEWNAKIVTIAGVQMTNEEAQRARRRFIENEDEFADQAVRQGFIRNGEQGELKHAMRRREALEDRVGRGNASNDERRELEALKASRMGRATDAMTAELHKEREMRSDAKASITKATTSTASDSLPNARDIFQSTPVAQKAFMQAAQPVAVSEGIEQETLPQAPALATRSAKVTGLEI